MNWTGRLTTMVLFGALALPAAAQSNREINRRKVNQQYRIAQGIRSGQLTPRETRHLEAREAHINRQERRMKADGNFTPAERARINREQNRTSRAIYRQKHDRQHR
jgi:hypothetical protein